MTGDDLRAPISDEAVTTMRMLVDDGDTEVFRQRRDALVSDRDLDAHWGVLLAAALTILVRTRFNAELHGDQVVRWVGKVRTRPRFDPADLDPVVAEGILRGFLGDPAAAETVAERQTPTTQQILIRALLDDLPADVVPTDRLMSDAVDWAERLLGSLDNLDTLQAELHRRGLVRPPTPIGPAWPSDRRGSR